jgi:hypothetical protein
MITARRALGSGIVSPSPPQVVEKLRRRVEAGDEQGVATCCNTDVICSTEHRFFFTAHPPGPLGADCAAETHSEGGLKKPEPLRELTLSLPVEPQKGSMKSTAASFS